MHSAAMILNPAYCNAKLTQNKDVMADLYALIDRWGAAEWDKAVIMTELFHFRSKKGLFSRPEALNFHSQPLKYWYLYGSETPVIQELAVTLFNQVTSASACETNWSSFEYIYILKKTKQTFNRKSGKVSVCSFKPQTV